MPPDIRFRDEYDFFVPEIETRFNDEAIGIMKSAKENICKIIYACISCYTILCLMKSSGFNLKSLTRGSSFALLLLLFQRL